MTTLTVDIPNKKDLLILQETLNRLGFNYTVHADDHYPFTKEDINGFLKTQKDFINGKTTARDWTDIEKKLNCA